MAKTSDLREARFSSYMVGEIQGDCKDLIPNSTRDDFVDNNMKTLFYNAIEREIELPCQGTLEVVLEFTHIKNPSKRTDEIIHPVQIHL